MCERKRKILQAIVECYLNTAEPVGSQMLSRVLGLNLSAATIRNELADLEQMGLLEKPHTSAGRVPSAGGYRLYVNSLMRRYELSAVELLMLRSEMELKVGELETLIEKVNEAISRITNYTAVAVTPVARSELVNCVKIVYVSPGNVVCVVSDGVSSVKTHTLRVNRALDEAVIQSLSNDLARRLSGKKYDEITLPMMRELYALYPECVQLITAFFDFLGECMDERALQNVYLEGAANIFNYPEYNDVVRAKELLGFMENRAKIAEILNSGSENMNVAIGSELEYDELRDCSVIIARFQTGGTPRGSVGIIGPMRMDYPRIISNLNCISERIGIMLSNMYFD